MAKSSNAVPKAAKAKSKKLKVLKEFNDPADFSKKHRVAQDADDFSDGRKAELLAGGFIGEAPEEDE